MFLYNLKNPRNKREIPCKKRCSEGKKGMFILGLIDNSAIRTIHQRNRQPGLVRVSECLLSGCPKHPSTNESHCQSMIYMKDVGVSNQSHPETRGYTEHVHGILGVLTILNKCILIGSSMFKNFGLQIRFDESSGISS